jgi:hypothetical protein
VIQRSEVLAASGNILNCVAGSAYEFARSRQVVSIGQTQSVTGAFTTIQSGADVVAEEFEPFILTTPPIIPDHMYYNDVMEIGDRLVLRVRNSTAGAITIKTMVQISQI